MADPKNNPLLSGLCIGFMIGLLLNALPFSDASQFKKAIKDCEKNLPRTQTCKVVGVPNESEQAP